MAVDSVRATGHDLSGIMAAVLSTYSLRTRTSKTLLFATGNFLC